MSRSSLALAVGLVCCVLLSSGLGAAAVTGDGAVTAGQVAGDSTLSGAAVNETTSETTAVTDSTTDATENAAEAAETTENTTDPVSKTADPVSDAAGHTTEATVEAGEDSQELTQDVEARSEETVGTTLGTASNATAQPTPPTGEPGRTPAAGNASAGPSRDGATAGANGTAAGAAPGGLGGTVPSPGGKPAAVGAGVGAAVAAGAAGRAYVGSTGGNPQAVTGLARTGASVARTAPRTLLDRAWRFLGAAGYALHSDDPLEHDTRAELVAAVEDNPGAYLSELADASDASTSTVRYHLKVLEREAVLTAVKMRGKRRYFPGDGPPDELAATLGEEGVGDVLRALARLGPASVSAVAAEIDRDPSTATHHLDRLADAGFVERERDGRAVKNRLTRTAAAALSPRAGDHPDSGAVESTTGD